MKRYAHRGLHTEFVENSANAVLGAYESEADGVEVDIRRLKDGTLALHHDPVIRTGDFEHTNRDLATLTWEQFRACCDHDPITLNKALQRKPTDKILIIECKPSRNRPALCRTLIETLKKYNPDNIVCSSESWEILTILSQHSLLPLAPVLRDTTGINRAYLRKNLWQEIHLRHNLADHEPIRNLCSQHGRRIITWTVNDKKRAKELEQLGIDGIMTDNKALLARR